MGSTCKKRRKSDVVGSRLFKSHACMLGVGQTNQHDTLLLEKRDNCMAQEPWHLSGEYFEACNCDLICPCLVQAQPLAWALRCRARFPCVDGTYGQTTLADRTTVLVISFPGPGKMRDGDWTAALYVDEQAAPAQQEALGQIFSGKVGGPMRGVSMLWSRFLGYKRPPSPSSWKAIRGA